MPQERTGTPRSEVWSKAAMITFPRRENRMWSLQMRLAGAGRFWAAEKGHVRAKDERVIGVPGRSRAAGGRMVPSGVAGGTEGMPGTHRPGAVSCVVGIMCYTGSEDCALTR